MLDTETEALNEIEERLLWFMSYLRRWTVYNVNVGSKP